MPRATPPGAPPRPRAEPPGALAVGAARCLSSPRWAMVGCCVCASPGRWASPSTGVRADACRGQPEVDRSAVQDGGGDPIGGGAVDGALVRRSLLGTVARARLRPATWDELLVRRAGAYRAESRLCSVAIPDAGAGASFSG